MTKKIKENILLAVLIFFLFLGSQTFAQKGLEVKYPIIPGVETPETVLTPLPIYLEYIYSLSVFIAGILSIVFLIWAGIQYITATGKPTKITKAKRQALVVLSGLTLILTSYLILTTINPQLLMLPPSPVQEIPPVIVPPVRMDMSVILIFEEIPLGAMITSEIGPSSFISTSTASTAKYPDPDTSSPDYREISSDVLSYSTFFEQTPGATTTHFQGALEGRRLKRIHQTASTTLPVIDMLETLSGGLSNSTTALKQALTKLHTAGVRCNCRNCARGSCRGNRYCVCDCFCDGDPCPSRDKFAGLAEIIVEFYKNDDSPLPCRMVILEYLTGAFKAFLEAPGKLVKNEDHRDQSYWHTGVGPESGDSVDTMRSKIRACISAGHISQARYDRVEELIDIMADVENKGTHSPKTDPPERDIKTNRKVLREQLQHLLGIRDQLNPRRKPQPLTRTQLSAFKTAFAGRLEEVEFKILRFPGGRVRAVDDPATFYHRRKEVISKKPSSLSHSLKKTLNDPLSLTNIALAQTPVLCARIKEIPIGSALTEAIQLVRDILREVDNIDRQGRIFIVNQAMRQNKFAKKIQDLSDDLIDFTKEMPMCDTGCLSECVKDYYLCNCDPDGRNCDVCCRCTCECFPTDEMTAAMDGVRKSFRDIRVAKGNIDTASDLILRAQRSIHQSFHKLNSENPETNERQPIGKDICCINERGDCRDAAGRLVKTEERDYTLIEKLVEVQKLLNRSRRFGDFEYLIRQLGSLLAEEEEVNNAFRKQRIGLVDIGGKYSLTDCGMTIADMDAKIDGGEAVKLFLNCSAAKKLGKIRLEVCNPRDPPLDCDYFDATVQEKKTPLVCHCYNEVWYPQHLDIASNFFCCVRTE